MPIYTLRDTESGRTIRVRADSPPNEQELDELFASTQEPEQPVEINAEANKVSQPFDIARVAEPEPFNPIQAEAVMNTPMVSPETLKAISPMSRILPPDSLAGGYERGLREALSGMTTPAAISIAPAFTVPYLGQAAAMGFGAKALGTGAGELVEAQSPAEAGGALANVTIGAGMIAGGAPAVRRAAAEATPAGRLAYELRDAQMSPAGLPTTAQVHEAGLREAAMPEAVRMTQRALEARAKQILREMEAPKPTPERPLRSEDVAVRTVPRRRIQDQPARPPTERTTDAVQQQSKEVSRNVQQPEVPQEGSEQVPARSRGQEATEALRADGPPAEGVSFSTGKPASIEGFHASDKPIDGSVYEGAWFAVDKDATDFYWSGEELGTRVKAKTEFQNPLVVSREQFVDSYPNGPTWWLKKAEQEGYDGVIIEEIMDGDTETTVFAKVPGKGDPPVELEREGVTSQPSEATAEPASAQSLGIAPEGSELMQRAIEFFTPPTPSGIPEIKIQHGARVPRFQDPATQKLLATSPQGMAKLPVLGQIMDPRAKAHHPADVSLITRAYSVEQGKTFAALWAQTQNRNKELFVADEKTGTIPLTDGTRGYMSDVIEAELREPDSQPITKAQRDWINKEWIPFRHDIDRMLRDEGVNEIVDEEFEYQVDQDYFPRPTIGKRGLPIPGGGGKRPGAKQFFEKARRYETEQEGARPPFPGEKKDQIIYDPNAISRGSKLLAGAYRAVADHRLANDPALEGRTVEQRYEYLVGRSFGLELLSKEERSEVLRDFKEQAARPTWIRERQVTAGPAFYGKIYPAEVADKIEKMFRMESSHIIQAAQTVTATSKAMLAVGDLSQFMIQGAPLLGAHPKIWAKAMANSIESLANPDVVARLLEEPHLIKSAEEFTQSGGTLFRLQDFLAGAKKGAPIERVPAIGPAIQRLGHAYGAFLDMAKIHLWKAYSPVTPKEQWGKLTETIENSVFMGRMESIGMNPGRTLAERLMAFAPAYYRGAGNLVVTAIGRDISAKASRRMLGGYAAAGLLFFAAGAAILGLDKDEIKRRLNPRSGKFMMLPVPLGNNERIEVGFGNILTQLFRLVFKAYGYHSEDQSIATGSDSNPYVKFLLGRAAFIPSLASDIVREKDYNDEPITIKEAIVRRFIPFAIQALFPRESETTYRQRPADALFTFFGFRTFPEGDFAKERRLMDELAQESHGKAFTDLTLAQRATVMTRFKQSDLWKKRVPSASDHERFLKMAEGRRLKLEGDIDKSQIKRITELGLRVGPYRSTITIAGQAVPLTEEERELYHNLLVEEYNKALPDNYMKSLEKMSAVQRENAWSERQALLRQTARGRLLRTLSN